MAQCEQYELRSLTFTYPRRERPALRRVDLTVRQGEFLVLCGPSGGGKTTLLRQLKPAMTPHGRREGEILFSGQPLESLTHREQSRRIGFVQQNPDAQIVTDKVWHELAFGLESLGQDSPTIRRRVAEMAAFFGIQTWFHQDTAHLSGGQKQLLNLASVMVMQPQVLILDEPTSQLDPIAAGEFLAVLGRVNRELGATVILTEHRLEEALPLASRLAVLDKGELVWTGPPREAGAGLAKADPEIFRSMPAPMRVWAAAPDEIRGAGPCPVTVREGRDWLAEAAGRGPLLPLPPEKLPPVSPEIALQAEEVWFRYRPDLPDVVKGLDLRVPKGSLTAILGGNGAGKTTALRLLAGLEEPLRGRVTRRGRVGLLPQDPQTLFVRSTLREDLAELAREYPDGRERTERAVSLCRLENLLDSHPYDLSGGEQQRAALAKILLTQPDILLLDEPTKGLDQRFKGQLAAILSQLTAGGAAILMVSHDVEFCARYAHRCALFFDGAVAAEDPPRAFFSGNRFYTTAANRMGRELVPQAVTPEDLMAVCGGSIPEEPPLPPAGPLPPAPEALAPQKLPLWRKITAACAGGLALGLFFAFLQKADLAAPAQEGVDRPQLLRYGLLFAALTVCFACVSRRRPAAAVLRKKQPPSRRSLLAAGLALVLIPLTLWLGETLLGGRKYYFIALLVLLECMAPFFLIFEGRKPQARELVVLAVLCALGVAGRAAFFMLPQFKPVAAVTVLAGAALGAESGFLVGAMTMLLSNLLFSQGPWTPWQMFAMGLVGLLAGALFCRGPLRPGRLALCVYGALASVAIYGGILNAASALLWAGEPDWRVLLTYWAAGFPMDCLQGAATWLFLWAAGPPMLEKLERIKVKYGLVERSEINFR